MKRLIDGLRLGNHSFKWVTRVDRWLLAMMAIGLVIRCTLAILLEGHMAYRGDEGVYTRLGATFFSNGFDTGPFVRAPLYFAFLGLTRAVFDQATWILGTKLLQCLAGVAVAIPVYRSGRRLAGVRAARFAAAFVLFDPTLIAYTHLLWPETLFLLIVALVFDGAPSLGTDTPWRSVVQGCLTGLAMLLKPVFGLFTVLLAFHWLIKKGPWRAIKIAMIFGSATAFVISPWVIRNQLLYGPGIIMENQGPYNLWSGNSPESPGSILKEWRKLGDPQIRSQVATSRGMEAIKRDLGRFARMTAVRAMNLWGLEYFAVRHLAIGGYGELSKGMLLTFFWIIQIAWVIALVSAAAGLGPVIRDPALRLVVTYSLVLSIIVSAMVSTTRFRVPFMFWIAIAAGVGVDRLLSGRVRRRTLAVMCGALLVLGFSVSRPVFWKIISADFTTRQDLVDHNWSYFRY